MQLILQKLGNNSNSFHRFETKGKEHSQITVIALNFHYSGNNCVPLSQTTSLCHIQSVSVTDSLCLSLTVCVEHRQSVSVTNSLCLSQTVCVCHRKFVSVTDIMCLSQTLCLCHRQYVSVTDNLCLRVHNRLRISE